MITTTPAAELRHLPVLVDVAGRPLVSASAHTAASTSHPDMREWLPFAGSPDADLNPEIGTMASRSRDLERNHGVAAGALQTEVDNVVGIGLRLDATPDYKALKRTKQWAEEWATTVESFWAAWWGTTACDVTRELTGDGLTAQVYASAWLNGAGLALPLWIDNVGPLEARTKLQVIEPDRLSNPDNLPDTNNLRGGVEVDAWGGPDAYHIRKTHPGDRYGMMLGGFARDWERIPARTPFGRLRVIHARRKDRPGQTRGRPALVSVMRQFKVLGDYTNAELKAAVVNAMVAMVTKSALDQDGLIELLSGNADALKRYQDALSNRKRGSVDFKAGMVMPLALGEELDSFTPGRPSTAFEPFVTMLFRLIGTGLNLPYELLLKDFSKTNYSSARAALNEAWRFFRGRRHWLGTYWMRPVYELWLEDMISRGLIDAPDFYVNRAAYCRCRWIGPGRGWVDPAKEVLAAKMRIELGISTLEQECAELLGTDWRETLEQRAVEIAFIKEQGLDFMLLDDAGRAKLQADLQAQADKPEEPAPAPGNPPPAAPAGDSGKTTNTTNTTKGAARAASLF